MPGVSAPDVLREAAERVRSAVSAGPVIAGATLVPVTVSVGAALSALGERPQSLLAAAARALTAAKDEGRDRVVLVGDPPGGPAPSAASPAATA
jgi:PleD family two-component response regulator